MPGAAGPGAFWKPNRTKLTVHGCEPRIRVQRGAVANESL